VWKRLSALGFRLAGRYVRSGDRQRHEGTGTAVRTRDGGTRETVVPWGWSSQLVVCIARHARAHARTRERTHARTPCRSSFPSSLCYSFLFFLRACLDVPVSSSFLPSTLNLRLGFVWLTTKTQRVRSKRAPCPGDGVIFERTPECVLFKRRFGALSRLETCDNDM